MQTTRLKHIALLADFCAKNGVSDVIISPGSRNAPLIIAFEAHPDITTHLIHDERVAGFYALGLAEASGNPVVVTCTSGSALLNYSPALVEAYYRQIPLLVLSADRPAHLVDQGDGQTMRQPNVYENFIKTSGLYPESGDDILNMAHAELQSLFTALHQAPKGPVHLNIPLNEPLYETEEREAFDLDEIMLDEVPSLSSLDFTEVDDIWKNTGRKLILVGQSEPNPKMQQILSVLAADPSVAVLVENTSNVQGFGKIVHCIDRTLASITEDEMEAFAPDLLISIGGAVISKRIKAYFRKHKAQHTWRVGNYAIEEDTFQSLTKTIKVGPDQFLEHLASLNADPITNFGGNWKQKDLLAQQKHQQYLKQAPYSDLAAFSSILDLIPNDANLHMGNSSVVRYCQLFDPVQGTAYFSNRGVSGIDGCSSTAGGHSIYDISKLNVLISGDISFFYDSNAFWNAELNGNLKVIVISNGGGGIFQFIPGPAESEHSNTFFAPTTASVKGICDTYNLNYYQAKNLAEIEGVMEQFFAQNDGRPSVLEICTQNEPNAEILKRYFEELARS